MSSLGSVSGFWFRWIAANIYLTIAHIGSQCICDRRCRYVSYRELCSLRGLESMVSWLVLHTTQDKWYAVAWHKDFTWNIIFNALQQSYICLSRMVRSWSWSRSRSRIMRSRSRAGMMRPRLHHCSPSWTNIQTTVCLVNLSSLLTA